MCKKCEHSCSPSKSKSDKGKIGVKGWLAIGGVGFVAFSAIGQSDKESSASAATGTKVSFGPLSSKYDDLFVKAGNEHGVSPILLASVAKAESEFNPKARSGVGAMGLMQFTASTAKDYGIDPWNPEQSVDGAARFFAKWKKQFGSDELVIAAYNAGPGNVQKAGNHVPKFVETQNYVAKVEANVRSAQQ